MAATCTSMEDHAIGSDSMYRCAAVETKAKFCIENSLFADLCLYRFRPIGGSRADLHTAADGHIGPGEKVNFSLPVGFYDFKLWRGIGPIANSDAPVYFGPDFTGCGVS
jgi:hypothetical protein